MARGFKGILRKTFMKILFIEPYPTEGPSSRYRVEQYIPYLKNNGIKCTVRPFISSKFFKIIYQKGYHLKKIFFFFQSSTRRFFDLFTAMHCDIIFIHLEAFPFGPSVFEWILKKSGKKIIYDLDDAIYLGITSPINRFLKLLKYPSKVMKILTISNHIITCNEFLADFARKYNKNVTAIHTSVDTDRFVPKIRDANDANQDITIGWIGSHTTAPYLEELKNVFHQLSLKYKFNLKIIGAGKHNLKIPGINVINMDWQLENEIEEFQSLDIGVYPLPENKWTLGKTGFKTIQYMSVGIPCVVSNVGSNKNIVEDGVNGYLANTKEEWIEKLSKLIEDPELRKRMGLAGRKTVIEKYSVKVNAPKLLEILQNAYNEKYLKRKNK